MNHPNTPEGWVEAYIPWVQNQTKDMDGIATRPGEFQNRYARLMWAAALREAAGMVQQGQLKTYCRIMDRAEELEKV